MPPETATPPQKRHWLFVLAVLLLLAGGAALLVGPKNFGVWSLGLVACIVSVYLIRVSNVHSRSASAATGSEGAGLKARKGRGRLMWIIGAALLPVAGASFFYLYQDALHGYHDTTPVYVFAGVAALCAVVWSYLVSRVLH
ncbi:MAG TPA: hypothetical protein VJR23_01930 [Candidatus Acidoferrales bacterium]|nr:hypothetical protein [Candidatus Acidoferrales bacterium]